MQAVNQHLPLTSCGALSQPAGNLKVGPGHSLCAASSVMTLQPTGAARGVNSTGGVTSARLILIVHCGSMSKQDLISLSIERFRTLEGHLCRQDVP